MNEIGTDEGSAVCGSRFTASPLPPSGGAYTTFTERRTGFGTIAFLRFLFCSRRMPIELGEGATYTDLGG